MTKNWKWRKLANWWRISFVWRNKLAFLIEGKNIPYFCTFVFPHDFLLKCSHYESEVIEIFIVMRKLYCLISFLRPATNLSIYIIKDSSMLRHGLRLICIRSYNDHNFVKSYQNLPKFGNLGKIGGLLVTLNFL